MNHKQWDILFEDAEILVCTKPHGIPVQSRSVRTRDMESMLKTYLYQQSSSKTSGVRNREPYLAVIHRLDQPVSGILVFAKTKKSAGKLHAQLTSAGFEKYYRALTDGAPASPEGILEDYLLRDGRTNTSAVCEKNTPGAKLARLQYETSAVPFFTDRKPEQTELTIRLLTGRHHQIRVQLAHMGCPIAGDQKYNPSPNGDNVLKLCACRLSFLHPVTGKKLDFRLKQDL